MQATTYTLECAAYDGIGWTSEPWSSYHYTVQALAEKLAARLGANRGDFCVIEHRAPTAAEAAAQADCFAHVIAWSAANGLDDIPF